MHDYTPIDRDNSRLMRLDRRGVRTPFTEAVSDLLGQLEATEVTRKRKRKGRDRNNLAVTLEAMVADLYAAYSTSPSLALGYSRNSNDYNVAPRYRNSVGSLTTVKTSADFLTANGYAEHTAGYYRRSDKLQDAWGNAGERSRLRATPELISFLEGTHGAQPDHIGRREEGELIRLKDAGKNWQDYMETADTKRMRKQLETLNDLIGSAAISLSGPEGKSKPDLTAKRLYRVFNDGRFDRGGRFYGGWWIGERQDSRKLITIDGEPTVELDYSALHLRLCYHLSGLEAPSQDDLYAIEGLEGMREAVKWCLLVLVNLDNGKRMPSPEPKIREQLSEGWTTAKLRKAVECCYADINQWLGSGKGTELQYIDSQIACEVLVQLSRKGVTCLPVHDSFIVALHHQDSLREAMLDAYSKVLMMETGGPKVYAMIRS